MADERDHDYLNLSLSLGGLPTTATKKNGRNKAPASTLASASLGLNLLPAGHHHHLTLSRNPLLQPSSDRSLGGGGGGGGGGIDVNRAPLVAAAYNQEDENAVSSPNSTVSSVSAGKRVEREAAVAGDHENDGERTSCSRGSDDEDGGGETGRKKLRLSREQAMVLEEMFKEQSTLSSKQKQALAEQLNLRPRQVEVWFQNRRARTKLKQTEVDCEYLKRCCEKLSQENQRLQKEVQELRALKLSPQLYMNMSPPTTLTMCPSCERVASLSSSSPPAASGASPAAGQQPPSSPVPISPWAALQVRQRPVNPPP